MGSNMAEAHPVGFQWVMEAKAKGARVIHIDPRFTRTSAVADTHVRLRAGSDIAFLGGVVHHVLENDLDFREYVAAYTNASYLLTEEFADTEDLDGLFSGYDEASATYDQSSWRYEKEGRDPATDPTLQHPRCVFQVLKRHYARYTPEMVSATCGVPVDDFLAAIAKDKKNTATALRLVLPDDEGMISLVEQPADERFRTASVEYLTTGRRPA